MKTKLEKKMQSKTFFDGNEGNVSAVRGHAEPFRSSSTTLSAAKTRTKRWQYACFSFHTHRKARMNYEVQPTRRMLRATVRISV